MPVDNIESILVVHPGKQHSYRTASALYANHMLQGYVTSVYNSPGHLTKFLYVLSKGKIRKKIASHFIEDVPIKKIKVKCEFLGVLSLIILKIPFIKKYYPQFNNFLNDKFGKRVAKIVEDKCPKAVISYDNNSAVLFEYMKKNSPNVIRILDVSIATRPFMKEIFKTDYDRTGEKALINNYYEIWNSNSIERTYSEIKYADYFLVPSQVVKKSLIYCGADEKKIRIVPYGTDPSLFPYKTRQIPRGPIKLIFVGSVDYRKGIHHLLRVVSLFSEDEINLKLVGVYDTNDKLYKNYSSAVNVEFCGFATHDELVDYYQQADVFVFPTLGEGFGMVVLEAMSCGLPVIITDVAGGNDVITDGVDGFEIVAGDEEQLYEKIKWFIDNRKEIPEMAAKARAKSEKYTWDLYSKKLSEIIQEILEDTHENISLCYARQ